MVDGGFLRKSGPRIAVLATMDTKSNEARFVADVLSSAGALPWIVDLSMRSHDIPADVTGGQVAEAAGALWPSLNHRTRQEASEVMIAGGIAILRDELANGQLSGAIGLGGANGTDLVCAILRSLPYLLPKVMISAVAGTAAVQWFVGESDICMYPSIGDVSLNRITKAVMEKAAFAVAAEAKRWQVQRKKSGALAPLIAVTSFGVTAPCVDRVNERLQALGYEVILFHASGVGGKSLERLANDGELAGVIDITTHELADLIADGVYSAGETRLTSAGKAGLPQVIVPGAIDQVNLWAGQIPERYRDRDFLRYNARNLLMRTNSEEFRNIGRAMGQRLNSAKGPVRVLIPLEGFSEHTKKRVQDVHGNDRGLWHRPEDALFFRKALRDSLPGGRIDELPLHINDPKFADACVDAFVEIANSIPR
jgi:uncharacterized protein (UPF0261 family)